MEEILSRFSVKKKIMVLISILFIVVMLSLGIVLDRVITKSEMQNFEEKTKMQAEQVDASMDLFLRGLRDSVKNMANDPILRNGGNITVYIDGAAGADGMIAMDPQAKGGFELQAYQLFQRLAESHKESISVVSYGTTDGGYLQYPAVKRKKGYDSRKRSWFKDSMADVNAVRITKPFKTSKGTPTVGIFATVKSMSGQPLGVLGINIDLLNSLAEAKNITDFNIDVFKQNGLISSHDKIKILGRGELNKAINVTAHAFSATAKKAIEDKGGVATVIE